MANALMLWGGATFLWLAGHSNGSEEFDLILNVILKEQYKHRDLLSIGAACFLVILEKKYLCLLH